MGAATFVGRVGGLAVALGLGAAVFTGTPQALADGAARDSASGSPRHVGGSESTGRASTATQRPRRAAGKGSDGAQENSGRNSVPRVVPTRRDRPEALDLRGADSNAIEVATATPAPAAATADQTAAAATELVMPTADGVPATPVAAPPATVTAVPTGIDLLDPPAGGKPGAPVDSPLGWATLAFARRQVSGLGGAITADPQTQWSNGLLLGTLNAVSARGLDMTYTVIDDPSLGGKVAWKPTPEGSSQRPDVFSYLPAMATVTDPTKTETFKVLIAEVTGFDKFITSIPVLGALAGPVLELLHRTPILNTLLSPIIGAAKVLSVTESAHTLAAGRPVGFTYLMPSFDGTLISVNYFPAADVATGTVASAPTVLNGPDLGFPGNTDVFSIWAPSLVEIVPGIPVLRSGVSPFSGGYTASTGFNVITWDPRGEWASGGALQLDSPFYEGRDVSSIISWAASQANVAQSQVATDTGGDPLVGMVGGSYGGGIQLTTAATDPRIDAIVPGIAWNTLNESLFPDDRFKTVIGTELLLALVGTGARINSQIYPAILTGDLFSWLSQSEQALLASAGPGILAGNITAASLFLQGTVDILFELEAANSNAELILNGNPSTPVKMTWFCGGHGVCLLPTAAQQAQGVVNMNDSLRWLDQYAAGNTSAGADTIPTFQWFDQTGAYHSSDLRPFDPLFNKPIALSYTDDGSPLLVVPLLGGSGPSQAAVPPEKAKLFSSAFALASGSKAFNALNLRIDPPVGTVIAGAPSLSFSYRGLGISRAVYAQLVDNATGQVVGNIVTPVTVQLDGRQRTVTIPMADIAYTVNDPGDSMTLQITSSALPYADIFAWGFVDISDVELTVPTVA